ncbi:hypothetical protein MY5147_001710 [Beauveria neobassiana]
MIEQEDEIATDPLTATEPRFVANVHQALESRGMAKIKLDFPDPKSSFLEKLVCSFNKNHGHQLPITHSASQGWFWDVRPSNGTLIPLQTANHRARSETMEDFPWHTDCSYEASPPRYFGLHVLQHDRHGGGTLSAMNIEKLGEALSPEARQSLRRNEYTITIPPEFIKDASQTKIAGNIMAFGQTSGSTTTMMRYRRDLLKPQTTAAAAALHELDTLLDGTSGVAAKSTVHLTASDCPSVRSGIKTSNAMDETTPLLLRNQSHALSKKRLLAVFPALALIQFTSFLDQTAISTSLPAIASALDTGASISLVGASFLITSTSIQLINGRLSDIFGRKAALVTALCIMGAGNLWSGFCTTPLQLFVSRACTGFGAGAINALVQIAIADITTLEQRGYYFGMVGMAVAFGNGLGPVVGGVLTQSFGWRWAFWGKSSSRWNAAAAHGGSPWAYFGPDRHHYIGHWAIQASHCLWCILLGFCCSGEIILEPNIRNMEILVGLLAGSDTENRAVLTGLRNFVRDLGGATGTTVSGTTLSNLLFAQLQHRFSPEMIARLTSSAFALKDLGLTDSEQRLISGAYMNSLRVIYVTFAVLAVIHLCLCLFIKDHGLKQRHAMQSAQRAS